MPSLQIRNMPQDVYDALAERARQQRRSLAQQAIVELSEHDARQRRMAAIEMIRNLPPIESALDPVELVREDRDSR